MTATERTRRSLHAVAEQLLAGPQFRDSGTIRLRAYDGGFGTVAEPDVRVENGELVAGDQHLAIDGSTVATIAAAAGIEDGAPTGLYRDGSGVAPDDTLTIDAVSSAKLAEAFFVGDAALRALTPDSDPVLWPEHFDLGIRVDEINYGVSPGDDFLGEPYAYVSVDPVPSGDFWNAPFGATRPLAELAGVDALVTFFSDGRSAAQEARS